MYGVVKKRALVHLRILSDHQKHGLKLMLFNVCCGNVGVLMHLRILPDQKTCFGAFAHTFRPQETWAQK